MRATRTTRNAGRRSRPVNAEAVKRLAAKSAAKRGDAWRGKPAAKLVVPLEPVLYKLCKPGWAVLVDRTPNATGHTICLPVLSEVASSTWSGAGI